MLEAYPHNESPMADNENNGGPIPIDAERARREQHRRNEGRLPGRPMGTDGAAAKRWRKDEGPRDTLSFDDAIRSGRFGGKFQPGNRIAADGEGEEPRILDAGFVTDDERRRQAFIETAVNDLRSSSHWGELLIEAVRIDKLHPKNAIMEAAGRMYDAVGGGVAEEYPPQNLAASITLMLRQMQEQARQRKGGKGGPPPFRIF